MSLDGEREPLSSGKGRGTVSLEERLSVLCGGGLAPPTQEVGSVVVVGVWWNVIVCLLVLTRLCHTISTVCGLPVVSQNFLENEPP